MMSDEDDDRWVSGKPVALVLGAVLIGAALFKWWPNDERAVRRQLDAVADTLTVPPTENDISRAARIAEFRGYFAPDVRVHAGESAFPSRDALVAAVEAWKPPPSGVFVELVDETIALQAGGRANVHATVRATSRDAAGGDATIDARDADLELAKRDGEWLITSVELRPSASR